MNKEQQKINDLLLLLNKEQQQIIDEAYENYLDITDRKWMNSDIGDLDDMIYDGYLFVDGDDIRVLKREEFIYIIKEVAEFSEKWGLKIEERELSVIERIVIAETNTEVIPGFDSHFDTDEDVHKVLDTWDVPTKLITLTYKDTIIESYE
jgi:hypothetical protein